MKLAVRLLPETASRHQAPGVAMLFGNKNKPGDRKDYTFPMLLLQVRHATVSASLRISQANRLNALQPLLSLP
jgi:hypothetical protein